MCINTFMDSRNNKFNEVHVIQINDLENFILWAKEQSCIIALRHIGNLFFNNESKYSNNESLKLIQEDISDEDIFVEIFPILIEDESISDIYYAISKDVSAVLGILSNNLIYNFLNQLVDMNILEMCWDSNNGDFMWRIPKN